MKFGCFGGAQRRKPPWNFAGEGFWPLPWVKVTFAVTLWWPRESLNALILVLNGAWLTVACRLPSTKKVTLVMSGPVTLAVAMRLHPSETFSAALAAATPPRRRWARARWSAPSRCCGR